MTQEVPARPLMRGDIVEIYRYGRLVRIGRIDDLMPESLLIWLRQDGNSDRRIYDPADGYDIVLAGAATG